MSTFDIAADAPGLLRAEAININLKFDRTGPTTGRISWNVPTPAAGCTAENQAYCGILITVDTKPASAGKGPVDGTIYTSDPTVDTNLFAGDTLDTAKVVGAFYQDRTTTFVDITGLMANTPYYVSGFPVDCQNRYFVSGVHAYSTEYANRGTDGTNGTQVVVLNSSAAEMGVQPTDATGLVPTSNYQFKIQLGITPTFNRPVDSVECVPTAPVHTITVNGLDGQTYEELIVAINKQFALLSTGTQGPTAPNAGTYYWNASQQKLFLWNGSAHVEVPVIVQATDPTAVDPGDYWYNTTTSVLYIRNLTDTGWDTVGVVINKTTDPTTPAGDTSYWYDGANVYVWNGNTWCPVAVTIQTIDPSLAVMPPDGSYWYNTTSGVLSKWNSALDMWHVTTAVQSYEDPNALPIGTYWFNEVTNVLSRSTTTPTPNWIVEANVSISETAPAAPAPGKLWYNPTTEELLKRNVGNTAWDQQDVITFPLDPTSRAACDLWWDATADLLKVWDALNTVWVTVTQFFQQATDPSLPPAMTEGESWFNSTTSTLYVWENNCFVAVDFVISATDPTQMVDGTVWHNTTLDTWQVWDTAAWVTIVPVESTADPASPPSSTFWFNTTSSGLNAWNGVAWVAVTYSTTPLTPATGTLWYDTATGILKTWNGLAWVAATPLATVELDCHGNMLFTHTVVGSMSYVGITDVTLFDALTVPFTIHNSSPGVDGASSIPSYEEIGIGTDGTESLRNAIVNDIRRELGYPVVDVELTKEQMDYAVSRAIQELRERSGLAYKRGFFFMTLKKGEQRYYLTNKIAGMNKIVDVQGVYRLTSSFLSSAHGAGVYGQIVLQHMYNMGTFDLLSYHIMAEYTKLMEILFAARITFTWNEQTREIWLHHKFSQAEPVVCIEATEERTEQDIMSDRYAKPWIRRYAAGMCRIMLAEIRGKFSSLPGASGSITLNAGELRQTGQAEIQACLDEIDNYTADRPEEYGMGTTFLFG